MVIQVITRNVYGNELIYPHNDAAQTLAAIAGTQSLKIKTLELARALGHSIELVNPVMGRLHPLLADINPA